MEDKVTPKPIMRPYETTDEVLKRMGFETAEQMTQHFKECGLDPYVLR